MCSLETMPTISDGRTGLGLSTVHHDVWDYDLPAQPTLARIDAGAGRIVPECRPRLISMRLLHCTPNHAAGHRCVKLPQGSLPNVQNPADTF